MGKTMEVAALVVVVKEGGERGKNRDAPDWHEGLRLLAALRQLGGVRRGIEIANAHYGYFPIEGRIPLSLSLSLPLHRLLPRFSLFLIPFSPPPRRTAHARDLSPSLAFAFERSGSLSPLRSIAPYTHQLRARLCLSFYS